MRVLVFLHSFEPGGVERVALRLCREWTSHAIDVSLVLGRSDGAMKTEAGELKYSLLSDGRFPTAAWETLWMIMRLPKIIRRERPDVLFCAGNSYSVVSVAMKLLLGRRCPPIVAKISNDLARADFPAPIRWGYHRWLRIQARFIDRFVGMAPPMRDEIESATGVARDWVRVVDDPSLSMAEIDRFATVRAPGKYRHRFITAGRLAPQKNFALLLRAFAKIARDDDSLVILGEGPERAKLEKLASSLDIAHRVTLAGHVSNLAPWFAQADVFALSSDYEGVPAVLAEALAAGLSIVTTESSVSIGYMLGNGLYGQVTPTLDIDQFATALERSRSVDLDVTGMRTMAQRFTLEKAASHYVAIFEEAIRLAPRELTTPRPQQRVAMPTNTAGLKP